MSHLEHLKSKLEESELLLQEAARKHKSVQKEVLKHLGFVMDKEFDGVLKFSTWTLGEEFLFDEDHAIEYAEEKGML